LTALFSRLGDVLGGDGIGKGEEGAFVAARLVEALDEEVEFEVEHRLQALAADVAGGHP